MPFLKFNQFHSKKEAITKFFWNEVIEAGLFKKVLKANVRRRIVSWSNWGFLPPISPAVRQPRRC